jgi:MATE family multidrug resistance protein
VNYPPAQTAYPTWDGAKEILVLTGPIILGSLSYTVLEFTDKWMVSFLGTEALAAVGSAGLWSFTLSTLLLGTIGCVSTFVAQCLGRDEPARCSMYTWQALYLSALAGGLAVLLYPVSDALFRLMQHEPAVRALETDYFNIRLLGYVPMAAATALAGFFQAVNRPIIPTYAAAFGTLLNIFLNYLLIFGKFGFPRLGLFGAGLATVIAQWLQCLVLMYVFLSPSFHQKFASRTTWRLNLHALYELVRVGIPNGITFFLDIGNWSIFTSFLVGYFGAVSLAAHNIAVSLMYVSFMPAVAINQGLAAIVGQWMGRGDITTAKSRTYTAIALSSTYMLLMGILFAFAGPWLIRTIFSTDAQVISLGHHLLVLAAIFQGFDGISYAVLGALRGAGDTRWTMVAMFCVGYFFFLPAAYFLAFTLGGGAQGAWLGAALYIIVLSGLCLHRFYSERWCRVSIFLEKSNA